MKVKGCKIVNKKEREKYMVCVIKEMSFLGTLSICKQYCHIPAVIKC